MTNCFSDGRPICLSIISQLFLFLLWFWLIHIVLRTYQLRVAVFIVQGYRPMLNSIFAALACYLLHIHLSTILLDCSLANVSCCVKVICSPRTQLFTKALIGMDINAYLFSHAAAKNCLNLRLSNNSHRVGSTLNSSS